LAAVPAPLRRAWLPGLVLLLALIARLAWVLFTGYTFEDAFITFRFARNLSEGQGFAFNPGEPIYGTTTPLLTLVLAAASWLGLDVVGTATFLGVMAGLGALGLWLHGMRRLGAAPGAQALGGLLLACAPLLWQMDGGGMETPLVLLLMLAAWLAAVQGRSGWAGVWLGAMLWTRVDTLGWALLPVMALWGQQQGRARWRSLARLFVGMFAVYLPWVLFAWAYFGSPLPYTVLAKWAAYAQPDGQGVGQHVLLGLARLRPFHVLGSNWVILSQGLLLILAVRGAWGWRRTPAVWGLLPFAALEVLRLAWQRATFFDRYFVPALWAVLALAGLGLALPFSRLLRTLLGGWLLTVAAGLFLTAIGDPLWSAGLLWPIFCALWAAVERWLVRQNGNAWARAQLAILVGLVLLATWHLGRMEAEGQRWVQLYRHERSLKVVGLWLADNVPADAKVLLEPIGYVGYFSRRVLRDEVGLVTPAVVQSKLAGQMDVLTYLDLLRPDYWVLHCDDAQRLQAQRAPALAEYQFLVQIDPLQFAQGRRVPSGREACYEVWGRLGLAP